MSGINSTNSPSHVPTVSTFQPTQSTIAPSTQPTGSTFQPTISTFQPSTSTLQPSISTFKPTISSTSTSNTSPTGIPIISPTWLPSGFPTRIPTGNPIPLPTAVPSFPKPTQEPTISIQPSISFTPSYSFKPSFQPTSNTGTQSDNQTTTLNNTIVIIVGVIGGVIVCIVFIVAMIWHYRRKKDLDDAILVAENDRERERRDHINHDDNDSQFNTLIKTTPSKYNEPMLNRQRISVNSSLPSSSGIISSQSNRGSQDARNSMMNLNIPCFNWNDIHVDVTQDMVIGEGSFGRVILAKLFTKKEDGTYITNEEIVVKVIKTPTKLKKSLSMNADYENEFRNAIKEVKVHMDAESKIFTKDCIAKVYGIVEGELPKDLSLAFNSLMAVGIVMRYEAGGSLAYIIHTTAESERMVDQEAIATMTRKNNHEEESKTSITHQSIHRKRSLTKDTNTTNDFQLRLVDKIRVLSRVALGLAELHKVGIVHGDIKPDNVLLSSYDLSTAEVRLADFGLAELREHVIGTAIGYSSAIIETRNDRGTPIYCAPEMLYDPFKLNMKADGEVTYAKPSEKTDMYAFSILAWEVLTQQKPFSNIKVAAELSVKVHQGVRPNISELPTGCPTIIRHLIETGWDSNRYKRRSAADCTIILRQCYEQMISVVYDVYLSHRRDENDKLQNCMDFVHRRLIARGLRVCFLNDRSLSITATNYHHNGSSRNGSSSNRNSSNSNSIDNDNHIKSRNNSYNRQEFDLNEEKKQQKIKSIAKAKVILICIDEAFQKDSECLYELQSNRDLKTPRQVIPLFLEPTHTKFPDDEIKVHCQLSSAATQTFSIASLASDDGWSIDEGPSEMLVTALHTEIDRLCDYIYKRINE